MTQDTEEILEQMRIENIDWIIEHRRGLAQRLDNLKKCGGTDDYIDSLLPVVRGAGPQGISLAIIHKVFPERKTLKHVRSTLVRANKIRETKIGNAVRLTAVDFSPTTQSACTTNTTGGTN